MQNFTWPPITVSTSSPSTGPNGSPIPLDSTLVGAEDPSGNLQPLQVDNSGSLLVDVTSSALPMGGATSNNQVIEIAAIDQVDTDLLAFKAANHTDLTTLQTDVTQVDTDLLAFKAANHTDLLAINTSTTQVDTDLLAFKAANHTDLTLIDTDLNAFKTANHTDLTTLNTSVNQVDTDLLAFKAANHTDLLAINTSVQAPTPAGTNIIGKVGIDQTTPGTTNGVVVNSSALPTGAANAANQTNGTQVSQVIQPTASLLNATVVQPTAANLNATIVGTVVSTPATPTPLTITQAAITVGTSAVRLTVSGAAPSATRVALVVTPDVASAAVFYIGGASVTNSGATRGIEIKAGQSFIANNDAGDYYIVSSIAAQEVTVMEQA